MKCRHPRKYIQFDKVFVKHGKYWTLDGAVKFCNKCKKEVRQYNLKYLRDSDAWFLPETKPLVMADQRLLFNGFKNCVGVNKKGGKNE